MTIRKMKIDRKGYCSGDPTLVRVGYNSSLKRLKRSSIADPAYIERARWRAVLRRNTVARVRWRAAFDKVVELGEAFLPAIDGKFPHRYEASGGSSYYGPGVSSDGRYWLKPKFKPTPHSGAALEELAEGEARSQHDEECEAELARKLAAITDEHYAAGIAYEAANDAARIARAHIYKLNCILRLSVEELKVLPTGRSHDGRTFLLKLNGRHYLYEGKCGCPVALTDKWPIGEQDAVFEVPAFKLDESCIGLAREIIRTRFGEPPVVLGTSKKDWRANVWIYGSVGLQFSRDSYSEVAKILSPKEVSSLLKRAK